MMINSCSEPCDGDSFFEWFGFSFVILDEETHENFFNNQNPDYTYQNFMVYDSEGNECGRDGITFFPYDDNRYKEIDVALRQPLTKYYFFRFNEYDQDTLKVIVKGTYSDPCSYEMTEYVKIYYNDKVVYYNLYRAPDETVKIYK